MFENLDVFRMSHAMAKHAGARQTVIAQNMANADTPGYVAKDIAPFKAMMSADADYMNQRATRRTHLHGSMADAGHTMFDRKNTVADPNGNSVSIETEMLHAIDTKRQHSRAVTIYKSALNILRTAAKS